MRAAEDRAKILSAAMAQLDEQTITIERELADAWMRCVARLSRRLSWFAQDYDPLRCARAPAIRTLCPSQSLRPSENEHQLVYTLNPLFWRDNGEVCRVPAYAQVKLPKTLLLAALRHQHVDYLNARRVQTLMRVHDSGQFQAPPYADDPRLVDLDALAAHEQQSTKADDAA
jgi:hypothetical protein